MALDFYLAPFVTKDAFLIDQESTAFDTKVFLTIQLLQLDHVKQLADCFTFVREEVKWKGLFGFEIFMLFETVSRHTDNNGIVLIEKGDIVTEVLAFSGATGVLSFG